MSLVSPETITLGRDILATKWYLTATFALMAYDYCLTFSDEVEYAWKGKRSPIFYLFIMNRYCPMVWGIITLTAFFSPWWTFEASLTSTLNLVSRTDGLSSCNRFAIAEWVQAVMIAIPAEIVLLFRVHALTGRRRHLLLSLMVSLVLAQCIIVVAAMAIPGKNPAMHVPDIPIDAFHVCVLYSDPRMDTAYLTTSLIFDSLVFALTLISTVSASRLRAATPLLQTIQNDGTIYFFVIFAGNLVWMILALCARPGLKFMNAQPSMLITSIMINRLTLSLKQASQEQGLIRFTSLEWASSISAVREGNEDDAGYELK